MQQALWVPKQSPLHEVFWPNVLFNFIIWMLSDVSNKAGLLAKQRIVKNKLRSVHLKKELIVKKAYLLNFQPNGSALNNSEYRLD